MKLQGSWVPALVVAGISMASGGWLLQQSVDDGDTVVDKARLLEEVHHVIADRYVEEVSPSELYQMAIDGMLEQLGDPYTSFLDEQDWEDLQLSTTGNYGGLGIKIEEKAGWITVVSVLPSTPAERKGLLIGDRIIAVEGESAEGWSTTDAVKVLRGPKGSEVNITVARIGLDKPLQYTIERDDIHVVAVESFLLDDRVGYLRLNNFSRESRDEMQRAIDDLREQGATSLVLDLRTNPGGLLEEGIAVSDLFLPRGTSVVATRSRLPDQNHTYSAPSGEVYPDLPVAVLVNGFSASASEIVAGALQDHDRALIVGTTTFGKGSVQTLYGLSGRNHLKVTTARWYTPSGRSIHKDHSRDADLSQLAAGAVSMDGDPIDVAVDTTDAEVFRTDAGRIVYGGGGITPDLIVTPDTLTTREQLLRSSLTQQGVELRNAAFRFGVEYAKEHADLPETFEVDSGMRSSFYQYLAEQGAEVESDLYEDAAGLVDYYLSLFVANAAFGEKAQLMRRIERDRQVERAVVLLRRADTPRALLTLAGSLAPVPEGPDPEGPEGDGGDR